MINKKIIVVAIFVLLCATLFGEEEVFTYSNNSRDPFVYAEQIQHNSAENICVIKIDHITSLQAKQVLLQLFPSASLIILPIHFLCGQIYHLLYVELSFFL